MIGSKEGSLRIKLSIRRLMAFVLLIAIGMAGAFTFAVVTLSATTIAALRSRGSRRAFFLGCTIFDWASMLLAFGSGPEIRGALPTNIPIIRVYFAINDRWPTTFKTPDEAQPSVKLFDEAVNLFVETVNRALTVGHSLISLAVALAGGVVMWLIARRRKNRAERAASSSPAGSIIV